MIRPYGALQVCVLLLLLLSTTSGSTLQSAQRQTTARHRTASCTSRSTVELHTDALHLARQLAGTLQQQLEAVRQDANARELQQRKDVSTAQETSRRIADAAAIREERMFDQFNAYMERSRADLLSCYKWQSKKSVLQNWKHSSRPFLQLPLQLLLRRSASDSLFLLMCLK